MNRREAFYAALRHETPDRVIMDLCGCPLASMTPEVEVPLTNLLGLSGSAAEKHEALLKYLDIDTRSVGGILNPPKSQAHPIDENNYVDAWGITRHYTGLYWERVTHPLEDATVEDLDAYEWPDPDSIPQSEIDAIAQKAKYLHENTDYIICAGHPVYGIFELGCWMCGFEDFLTRLIIDEPFVHRFNEIIMEYQKKVIARYYSVLDGYVDFTSSGDDFATQSSLFMSPDHFRRLIAPYFKERIQYTKSFIGCSFLHHSCGNVSSLIPQLMECGVDILNPIQPTGPDMKPEKLKAAFGDKIVFHGGLDTQKLLPEGSPEEVRQKVNELLSVMQPGGGYIFAAAHNLQGDVPPENVIEMFKAARDFRI